MSETHSDQFQTGAQKLKLMVVEDEQDNLDLLYRTFRRNYQVYTANNARKAIEILDEVGEMAVIISDQKMPQMNGSEFFGLTVERYPDTMRILLTGFTDVEDLVDAINSGQVFKYITKPWKPDELKAIVEQAAQIYRVVKKRTWELSRALRRESLFNAVTTAIRESLDYQGMLQKIVATIGETFDTSYCFLIPVEGDRLSSDKFYYLDPQSEISPIDCNDLIELAIETRHYQVAQNTDFNKITQQLVVPLIYPRDLLAVLSLYQQDKPNPWSAQDIQLITGVAEQAALAVSQAKLYQCLQQKQDQIHAELEVARQIQHNLLRQTLPDIDRVKIQACCYPAREVGGDFFEVFVHPKGDIWLAVGDVSGKGVPAALFMASAISVLRRELYQETPPMPNVVMHNLNNVLSDDLVGSNCFITLVLARYNCVTQELVYANAGHIYPLVWSPKATPEEEPLFLKVRSVPLGILPKWQADSGHLTLAVGDILLLTSDGITEAMVTKKTDNPEHNVSSSNANNRSMLTQVGLWQILQEQKKPLSLHQLLNQIQAETQGQDDDQTILSLEVR